MQKRLHSILLLLELSAFPLLMVLSWVCNIYGMKVQSLLDNDGLRWMLESMLDNFTVPLVSAILLSLLSIGFFISSGLPDCILHPHHVRLKHKRALMFTLASVYIMISFLLVLLYKPESVLLNFLGGYEDSPLIHSIPTLIFLFVEVISSVYGYTSGRIITSADFIRAHVWLLQKSAPLIVHLFLICQLIAWINYAF